MTSARWLLLVGLSGQLVASVVHIVPTPQYLEPLNHSLVLPGGSSVTILLGPARAAADGKMHLAGDFLGRELRILDASLQVDCLPFGGLHRGPAIYVWDYSTDSNPPIHLNLLDQDTLAAGSHYGQSYVIRTPDTRSVWVIGSTSQGALFGIMSLVQLLRKVSGAIEIPGVYVRDYPDFEFRAASDWLLNGEINRWALDRGQGVEAFARLCERKLDRALRYKINMVLIDGFGWGLEQRFKGYPELMRGLNRYARARGIHLLFGGYGASYGIAYQTGPLYEEGAYLGRIFENRDGYPDGPTYPCMGFPGAKKGVDPSILGSCRANEDLNRMKAEELRRFVEAVEPGALYIHHEDFGGFKETEKMWLKRCERCRKRWPADSLLARDGGAGALANGYSALIRAINSVKNPAAAYDASRDCQIILVSPVYVPDSPGSDDWSNVLQLWQNIGLQLPSADNVQFCFREVFPQHYGSEKWVEKFNSVMRRAGLNFGVFLYFAGGADNFLSDYPLSGAPALNALFQGSRTMYNASGDFYREPMEILNAEYSWNTRSTGFFRDPLRNDEAIELWRRYMYQEGEPREIFGPGGLYEEACNLLYGPKAGPIMAQYYRESAWIPDAESRTDISEGRYYYARSHSYLPMTWDRAYAIPTHWRHLAVDAHTWQRKITNEAYLRAFERLKIERSELHRRLARRWKIAAELNERGAKYIEKALVNEPQPSALEDLHFLQASFRVYRPLLQALADFHDALVLYFSGWRSSPELNRKLVSAIRGAQKAHKLAVHEFPNPIDPVGGEVGALRLYSERLMQAVEAFTHTR